MREPIKVLGLISSNNSVLLSLSLELVYQDIINGRLFLFECRGKSSNGAQVVEYHI